MMRTLLQIAGAGLALGIGGGLGFVAGCAVGFILGNVILALTGGAHGQW